MGIWEYQACIDLMGMCIQVFQKWDQYQSLTRGIGVKSNPQITVHLRKGETMGHPVPKRIRQGHSLVAMCPPKSTIGRKKH